MEDLFELMVAKAEKEGRVSVGLGIRVTLAGHETLCPVTLSYDTYEAFEGACQTLLDRVAHLRQQARTLFASSSSTPRLPIGPDTPAQEIWGILSTVADEAPWVAAFNELSEPQRRAVADHVLTHCNIFSGKAAVFSRRYDSETGLMGS